MNDLATIKFVLGVARYIKLAPGVKYTHSYVCV